MVPSLSCEPGTCVPGSTGVDEQDFYQSVNEKPIAFRAKSFQLLDGVSRSHFEEVD